MWAVSFGICAGADSSLSISSGGRRCSSSPCQHNGVCEDSIRGYTCTCAEGYEGENCAFGKALPPSEEPHLILPQAVPMKPHPALPWCRLPNAYPCAGWNTQLWQSRVVCAACLPTKHYGIPRFQRLSQCPEPPFSGHAAKELKPNPLLGTPQSQPCRCHLCCLAACPAVVPGLVEQGCGARVASQAPSCFGGHTAPQDSPWG